MLGGRRILSIFLVIALMLIASGSTVAADSGKNAGCATIQSGTLVASTGETLTVGFDGFGYNYQAHLFAGPYSDYDRAHGGLFSDVDLQMKWNDSWLSNKSCDGDNKLDRHQGYASYRGSGAWLTNHDSGVNADGSSWTYFIKIVAVPVNATLVAGTWYAQDGAEIGPDIWGQFAVVQQVITGDIPDDFVSYDLPFADPYRSPSGPGLGGR